MDVPVAVPTTAAAATAPVATPVLIATMLRAAPKISDLIFSPRPRAAGGSETASLSN